MDNIFSGSKELVHILQWHDYSLYDITTPLGRMEPLSWDEIAMNEPAQNLQFGNKYLLVPSPEDDQTLRQAYNQNRADAFFPMMRIPENDIEKGICQDLYPSHEISKQGHRHYLLHELYFQQKFISAFSSLGVYLRNQSRLTIPTKNAVEIFSRYFTVAQFTKKRVNIRQPQKMHVN